VRSPHAQTRALVGLAFPAALHLIETGSSTVDTPVSIIKHGKGEGLDKQVVEILSVMVTVPIGRRIVHGLYLSWWNNGKPKCPSFWLQARLVIVPKTNPPFLNLNCIETNNHGLTIGGPK